MSYEMKCYEGEEPRIEVTDEFVERNKLSINIGTAKRIMDEESVFGFEQEVAYNYLSFEEVKPYLTEESIKNHESGKDAWRQITDVKEAAQDFLDYMVFAWMKTIGERGLSAGRSIAKLATWMRILGRDDVAEVLLDERLYAMYGRPALRMACEMLGIKCPDDL